MKSVSESIQALSRAVLSEAQAEAEHILADGQAKAEAILKRAREQAAAERERIIKQAQRKAEQIRSQAIAAARLKARTMQLERREKLLNQVFAQAEKRLPSVRQWRDYDQIVRRLVQEAVQHLDADEARILADDKARELLAAGLLEQIAKETGIELQLGPPLEQGTGVVAETVDGKRRYDNTLEARLIRRRDLLRPAVYRLLMGESL